MDAGRYTYHTSFRRLPGGTLKAVGHWLFQTRSDGYVREVNPADFPEMMEIVVEEANKQEIGKVWMADQAAKREARQAEAERRDREAMRLAKLRDAAPELLAVAEATVRFLVVLDIEGAGELLAQLRSAITTAKPA